MSVHTPCLKNERTYCLTHGEPRVSRESVTWRRGNSAKLNTLNSDHWSGFWSWTFGDDENEETIRDLITIICDFNFIQKIISLLDKTLNVNCLP